MHHAVAHRAGDQRVLRSGDRAEQQRARLKPADVMPLALLHGVHRVQVERAGRDQPQHLRTFEVEAGLPGQVETRPHLPERGQDDIALGYGRHLNAP